MEAILYVYKKSDEIIALERTDIIESGEILKKDGWEHVGTINAVAIVKHLCNERTDAEFREKFIEHLTK